MSGGREEKLYVVGIKMEVCWTG